MNLVLIPEGPFWMGSEDGQENEQPVREVTVKAFEIATHPVTNADYAPFVAAHPSRRPSHFDKPGYRAPEMPVVAVSWFDAVAYCEWLSVRDGRRYRLPTEAEREKAARGGVERARFPWGNDLPDWIPPGGGLYAVGGDPPNGYGLHNMGDLVHEWCADWYKPNERRASRGGSWRHDIRVTRCAARSSLPPDRTFTDYGFRVAI